MTEQFLESCPLPIQIYLKERGCKSSANLVEHAAQYLDAHGKTMDTIPRRPADKTLSSATALTAYSGPTGQCCLFCDYQHATNKCRKAKQMSVPERRERLIRAGACFWCLELRHRAADCPANRPRCERCSGPHHFLLCERATSRTVNAAQADAAVPDQSSNATVIAASAGGCGAILMQTAQVYATGESQQIMVRVMLDTGSSHSSQPPWLISFNAGNSLSMTSMCSRLVVDR